MIGRQRRLYDVWGDTVNTASRMESTGEPGRIQVSDRVRRRLAGRGFALDEGRVVHAKGPGDVTVHFLEANAA